MTPYESLAIMPWLVAETVCETRNVPPDATARFVKLAETRCRVAYDAGADWFIRIAKSRTNHGRNQLYVFVNHWLDAFLMGKPNERNEQ